MIIDEQLFEAKDKEIAELRAALDEARKIAKHSKEPIVTVDEIFNELSA